MRFRYAPNTTFAMVRMLLQFFGGGSSGFSKTILAGTSVGNLRSKNTETCGDSEKETFGAETLLA